MYTACLYCSHSLGTNELVEELPIGRRLAFDAVKGRLWVVCGACQRWGLVPIEERWEAIDRCEQLFREARLRASTSEIGLVRLREGLELVRIGAPLKPEMAAWRYGREFSARRRRAIAIGVPVASLGVLGAGAAVVSGAGAAFVSALAFGPPLIHITGLLGFAAYAAVDSLRVTPLVHDGRKLLVYRADLKTTHLLPTPDAQGWGMMLKHSYGRMTLTGDEAVRTTARLLARANGSGTSSWKVAAAASRLSEAPVVTDLLRTQAAVSGEAAARFEQQLRDDVKGMDTPMLRLNSGKMYPSQNPASINRVDHLKRLALEMALHEETERQALEGELAPLVAAWREAEEIAGIADRLLIPPSIDTQLDTMRATAAQRRRD
jgi:hypothetical protein